MDIRYSVVGKKLREKDFRTGYEKGFKDALKFAMEAINREMNSIDEEAIDDKERSVVTVP